MSDLSASPILRALKSLTIMVGEVDARLSRKNGIKAPLTALLQILYEYIVFNRYPGGDDKRYTDGWKRATGKKQLPRGFPKIRLALAIPHPGEKVGREPGPSESCCQEEFARTIESFAREHTSDLFQVVSF